MAIELSTVRRRLRRKLFSMKRAYSQYTNVNRRKISAAIAPPTLSGLARKSSTPFSKLLMDALLVASAHFAGTQRRAQPLACHHVLTEFPAIGDWQTTRRFAHEPALVEMQGALGARRGARIVGHHD